jgi:hypothetical protein
VPAGLLCPQAEKSAFVETKHGYTSKLQFLTTDYTDFTDFIVHHREHEETQSFFGHGFTPMR